MANRAIRNRLLAVIAGACAALAVATPFAAADEAGGANNVILVTTTADGSSLARSGVQVSQTAAPTIASANIAAATSRACTGCTSVAVAFQAVLVTGNPSTVAPGNAAVATNDGCSSCTSYAFAYQYVLSVRGPAYLDPSAQQQLAAMRAQIADLAASGLPPDELTARLDAIAAQFRATIAGALHPVDGAASVRIDVTAAP